MWMKRQPGYQRPMEDLRWELAERFGWTLAEVDALSLADMHEYLQVTDGRNKAHMKGESL